MNCKFPHIKLDIRTEYVLMQYKTRLLWYYRDTNCSRICKIPPFYSRGYFEIRNSEIKMSVSHFGKSRANFGACINIMRDIKIRYELQLKRITLDCCLSRFLRLWRFWNMKFNFERLLTLELSVIQMVRSQKENNM